uniref:RNA-directed DNA polymerase n=1 Tax=Lactuca sativa TaxID=4236 RepID=A0A9R1WKZ5_LACSA|nr:hypothetical protein LSAT_V11C900504380 [Lactuca sativa]
MNIVQEMTMAANAYKAHNNTQLQIVNIITSGFTGSLKGWWDFYISQEEKYYILSAKKTIIKQENNQQIQTFEDDMVNTLIFAIIKNFVGDPTTFQEKTSEILMNLHCRKLTDFRWYKDNYLVKVFSRPDCKESYWKERFIAGLPKLFAERVRQKLRENFNNTIPYQNLTYGDLINYINKEGLAVCADLRFKEKLKKDRINSKNELGNFCQQYGYQPLNVNNCYAKTKINELNVSEDLKEQIRKIILNTDSDSDESISDFQTNDLNILENTTSSSEDSDICECIGKCHCNNLINVITSSSINVLSQDDKDLLNSLDSIKDKNIQELLIKQMLNKTNNITPANNENFNLKNIYERFTEAKPISMQELQEELKIVKQEIKEIKNKIFILEKEKPSTFKNKNIEINNEEENKIENVTIGKLINNQVSQKWNTQITLVKDNFKINLTALIDSGVDMNCIQEGIFTQFYEKTTSRLTGAGGIKLIVNYKVSDVHICNDQDYCYKTHLILVKDLSSPLILGTPFITKLYPFMVHDDGIRTNVFRKEIIFKFCEPPLYSTINVLNYKTQQAKYLINEINNVRITNQLNDNNIQNKIIGLKLKFEKNVCSNIPNAFWNRKQHIVKLPYIKIFNEKDIPSKSRAIHMNNELESHCKNEIQDLINKKLIRPKSPWSYSAFYVMNAAELERGSPRLVINYKPLNKVLEWIRYPIPNKRNLLKKLYDSKIFSKFDMKSGFWQIQLHEEDKYKTGFNVPFGHFEWNVMPFGLKNAPSEFQNIMNDIITPISSFAIAYIDDVLIFSKSIDQHFKHLNQFHDLIYQNGLVVSAAKMHLFKNEIRFLGHDIVPTLPCLNLPHPDAKIIVETDASDIGFGGILKQKFVNSTEEQLVRYYSGAWNDTQKNYSTVKKEILNIVLCIKKFEDDLFMKSFLLRIDCQYVKTILKKDVKNIISKQIFARWQALLGKMSSSSSSKHDDKKPVSQNLVPVSQKLVPFQNQNRFSPLTPTSKNSQLYSNILQSKLVTPKVTSTDTISPFAKPITPQTQKSITPSPSTKTPYFKFLKIFKSISYTKVFMFSQIISLDKGKPFMLIQYYQAILQESGSVNFVHRSNSKEGNIDFSKAHIIKIISLESWVPNLHSEKPLISYAAYPRFSYYDYQDAWTKAFFIRNYSHSWFIFFDLNFNCEYPRWFINWYKYMGILPNCLPKEIYAGYLKFKNCLFNKFQNLNTCYNSP